MKGLVIGPLLPRRSLPMSGSIPGPLVLWAISVGFALWVGVIAASPNQAIAIRRARVSL
jgi:hypothetical protein